MRRFLACTAATLACGAAAAAPAAAQEALPACSPDDAAMEAFAPRWAPAGGLAEIEIEGTSSSADAYPEVRVIGPEGDTVLTLDRFNSGVARVRMPARAQRVALTVAWTQVAGAAGLDSPACSGSLTRELAVVGQPGKVGDLAQPHVGGRWRAVIRPAGGGAGTRFEWHFRGRCTIGACQATALVGGRSKRFRLGSDGGYRTEDRPATARSTCSVVDPHTGQTVRTLHGQVFLDVRIELRAASSRPANAGRVATRMVGTLRQRWAPSPGSPLRRCGPDRWSTFRISAVRP